MKTKKLFKVRFVSQDEVEIYAYNKIEACKLARIEQGTRGGCKIVVFVKDENNKIL